MNILFLSELFYPHGGGAELATYLYARLLSEAGMNVLVVTNRFPTESGVFKSSNLMIRRVPLIKHQSQKYSTWGAIGLLISSFMRNAMKWADVVYVPRFWYSGIMLAKRYRKPAIVHLHDYEPICPVATAYDLSKETSCEHRGLLCSPRCIYAYEMDEGRSLAESVASIALNSTLSNCLGRCVTLSDSIICVSHAQKNILLDKIPSLQRKTTVIYNPPPPVSYVRPQGDDFAYFGGPKRPKGFHTLCAALREISLAGRRPMLVHATNLYNHWEKSGQSCGQLGVLSHKRLDGEGLERLYAMVRCVIAPSVSAEPLPYVAVEALLRGRCIIASKVGGLPEILEGCKGALLFEPGNSRELAQAMESIASLDRGAAHNLGLQNRETALKRFNSQISAGRFIDVCDSLI